MRHMKRVVAPILLFVIASACPLWSGTTGKIAGTITDKANGEPLPGANAVVVGTALGAATNLDGRYAILEVPPGTYSVEISLIGYKKVMFNDVRVFIDQTARVNVALEQGTVDLGEVVIEAERKFIKPDVATSVVSVSSKEIESMPVTSVVGAIGLQAGIRGGWGGPPNGASQPTFVSQYTRGHVSVQGGLNIRGGEGDNILFLLDGVTLRDPRNSEPTTNVPLSSVSEISVERGGFNAEYGQVRSGIVNVVSKEGGKQGYTGSIQFRFSPPAPKYWRGEGIRDIQDPYSFVLRPYFDPAVCWTGTDNGTWDEFTRAQYPQFPGGWNNVSKILNTDNNPNNDLTPLGAQRAFEYETRKIQPNNAPDYDIDGGFGGPVPFIGEALGQLRFFTSFRATREMLLFPLTRPDYKDYDFSLQMISDITPTMRLRLSGLVGKQFTIRHNWDGTGTYFYPRYPTDIANVASSISSSFDLIGLFSDFNFSLADIGHQSLAAKLTHTINPHTYYEVSLEHFRRDYNVRPSALRDTSQHFEIFPGFSEDSNPFGYWPYEVNGVLITGGSHIAKARDFSIVSSTTLKADFTSQLNFANLVKGGAEFDYNDLDFDYGTIASATAGQTYSSRVQMHVFPVRGALYVQDKLELQEFTVNAGLRLDYSNSRVNWWAVDPYDRNFFSSKYNTVKDNTVFPTESPEAQWQLSPRLGVAHPITENSKLYFNYGHFKQVPQYESLFRVSRDPTRGQMASYGNPNLILAKTVSYELGFDYLFLDNYLLQVSGFYNDITDQQDFTTYFSDAANFSYTATSANNYQDTRGFELTLRKNTGRWWTGFANYTYQVNTTGHFGSARLYDNPTVQKQWNEATVNLYQDRPIPQPYARASINLFTPEDLDFGPKLFDHSLLGGFLLNVVFDWQAGYWTTFSNKVSIAYNVQAVDYYNLYLRLEKTVTLGKFSLQLFMDMNNVLNTLRLWNTGDQDYLESLHLPQSEAYSNIPGDDKVGNYRKPGVEYQPMINGFDPRLPGKARAIYYDQPSGGYFEYVNNQWSQVDKNRINRILDDKAYIDMPNASTYWFLDPRKVFFGMKVSFTLD